MSTTSQQWRAAWERGRAAGEELVRSAETHPTVTLALVLALGLLVRLPFLKSTGFPVDVHDFEAWALRLADVGPGHFYQPGYFADFLPGYLWWLWLAGSWARAFGVLPGSFGFLLLLKLPTLVASLAGGTMLYAWLKPRLGARAGYAAAALYLVNPAVIFAGPVWGQVDELAAALIFGGTLALLRGRAEIALPLGLAAMLTKPQVAVLAPIWLAIVILPYVRVAAADRLPRISPARLGVAGIAAGLLAVLVLAPFRLGPAGLVQQLRNAVEVYPYTSVGALNFWSLPFGAPWQTDQAHFGPVTLQLWGGLLFLSAFAAVIAALVRRPTVGMAMAAGAIILVAFFVLPTRIHERYLIPAFLFLAALAVLRPRWLALYAALTGLLYLNLLRVYTTPLYATGMPRPRLLDPLLERPGMWGISLGFVLALAMLLYALQVAPDTLAGPTPARAWRPASPPVMDLQPAPSVARRLMWSLTEVVVLVLLVSLVFGVRVFRLAEPRAPVFDEVYHPRTAMEYLAFVRYGLHDEVYEFTHPPLAKELMAAGIVLWGNHRVVHQWHEPIDSDLVVADGRRHQLYAATHDPSLVLVDARDGRILARRPLPGQPTALATSPSGNLGVGIADGTTLVGPPDGAPRWVGRLEAPARRLLAAQDEWWALSADGRVYRGREGSPWQLAFQAGRAAEAITVADAGEIWVGGVDGISVWDRSGRLLQELGGPPVHFLAYNDTQVENETRVVAAGGTFVDIYAAGRHSVVRHLGLPSVARVPTPLVLNGHAHLLHISTAAGVQVVDLIGNSPFTRVVAPPGSLVLDADAARPDSRNQVYLWNAAAHTLAQIDGGHNAFGWRLPGVLFAALLALGVYFLARDLLGSIRAAQIATFLVAFDFMSFSQSRIGTPDIYVAALVVLAYWAVFRGVQASGWRQVAAFTGGGLALGGACASKWVGVYAAVALLLGLAIWAWRYPAARARPARLVALAGLTLVGLPAAVYLASYALYFAMGHSFANFLALQQSMYHYHATLTAPHPAASPWWSWPLVLKPVWFYSHSLQTDGGPATAVIYDAGNLAIWWPLVPALVALAVVAWRRRMAAWLLPPWASLGQWLPWVRITRVGFLYHFFSVVPFGMVALGYWVERALSARASWRWAAVGYLALVVLLFVLIYPWISAVPIHNQDLEKFRWLASWAYDFQFYPSKIP